MQLDTKTIVTIYTKNSNQHNLYINIMHIIYHIYSIMYQKKTKELIEMQDSVTILLIVVSGITIMIKKFRTTEFWNYDYVITDM